MDDPTLWAGIWLATSLAFAGAEIVIAGTFFLLPFAAGALVAAIASLFGVALLYSWAIFLVVSVIAFWSLRPLARRLEAVPEVEGVGANRLLGAEALVIETIPAEAGHTGRIKVGGEEWVGNGLDITIPEGAAVRIIEIRGTQAIVEPI